MSSPSVESTAPPRLSPSARRVTFESESVYAETTSVYEIYFYEKQQLKSKLEANDKKEKSGNVKLELKETGKERSLDPPSMRQLGSKGNRFKNTKYHRDNGRITGKNSSSLQKLQVEDSKEVANSSIEPTENFTKDKVSDLKSSTDIINDTTEFKETNKSERPFEEKLQQEEKTSAIKPISENKNKFTWCGSCKASKSGYSSTGQGSKTAAAATVSVKSKRSSATSPMKKLSRSSLTAEPVDNNKINLNLSKYSPCASRLAASSKILSTDAAITGGTSPESPLHVSRSKSPVQPSLSLSSSQQQQQTLTNANQPPMRSKSLSGGDSSCVTSPTSEGTNLSCSPPGTEILSLDEVNGGKYSVNSEETSLRATAPASAIELSLDRDKRTSNYRSLR